MTVRSALQTLSLASGLLRHREALASHAACWLGQPKVLGNQRMETGARKREDEKEKGGKGQRKRKAPAHSFNPSKADLV